MGLLRSFLLRDRNSYELAKKRMRFQRARFKFGMKLRAKKKRMVAQFYNFHQTGFRINTCGHEPLRFQNILQSIIEFVTMTMPFVNCSCSIRAARDSFILEPSGISPKPHRSSHFPGKNFFFLLAKLMAFIFPSIPLDPNPPGTIIPSNSPSSSFIFSGVFSYTSASSHEIFGILPNCHEACFIASITDIYESKRVNFPVPKYFPTMPMLTSFFEKSALLTIRAHSFISRPPAFISNFLKIFAPSFSFSKLSGTW